jgi:cytochrome c oxidase subunit 3
MSRAGHAHADHPIAPQEQFDSMRQQRETGLLGMWVFLATELLLFGGLFTCYGVYRYRFPEGFHEAGGHRNRSRVYGD